MAKRKSADSSDDVRSADSSEPSFEDSLARLEEIAEQLEDGQLGLGESLAHYEEGVKHLKQCHELLAKAERKIELLAGIDDEGNAIAEPFDDTASTLDDKVQPGGRRRARPEKPSLPTKPEVEAADIDDGDLLF